jgi:hypothetical protein
MGALLAGLFSKNMLPIVLGGLAGLALLVGGIVLYEKGKHACQAEQAAAIKKAQDRADALGAQLLTAQAQYQKQLDDQSQAIRERIIRVPVTTVCRDSPAIGAAIDGIMQQLGGKQP